MDTFREFYNHSCDMANCIPMTSLKDKEKFRDMIMIHRVNLARHYVKDIEFKKEADEFLDYQLKYNRY
jgi:hypothetical protein